MDSFEWNKIIGAVLFALLVSFGLSALTDGIFSTEAPETPGYVIAVATEGEGGEHGGAAPAASEPIGVLLANADPTAGATSAKKCGACHTFGSGEANKVGPNLYGIVTRPIAAHEGYEYSDAMKAFAEETPAWDYEHLNSYLTNPKAVVPGTKMAFAGLKNDSERANVIAYLRTLSDSPAPLPAAEAAAPAEGEAAQPAEQAAAAGAAPAAEQPAAEPEATADAAAPAAEPAAPAEEPAAPAGTEVAQAEAPAAGDAAAGGVAAQIAAADVAKGETFAKRCAACHTFDSGGANKVGPNLYGIVDRPVATHPDYAYSDAMTAFSEGGAKTWSYDALAAYLENPKGVVPGSKMVFPGIKKEEDRANVIAYLRTLAETPAPLPGAQ